MNLAEAKTIVRKHPKKIGVFRRDRFTNLSSTSQINWMLYRHPEGFFGSSVGDGRIYAVKAISTEDGIEVLAPDTSRILSE